MAPRAPPSTAAPFVPERRGVLHDRGEWVPSPFAPRATGTVHPSSILRAPDSRTRRIEIARFVADLRKVARVLG